MEIEKKIDGEQIIKENLSEVQWNKYLNLNQRLKDVVKLYAEGNKKADIARKFQITRGAVTQYFNNNDVKEICSAFQSTITEMYLEETAINRAENYLFGITELKKLYHSATEWEEKFKAIKEIIKESKPETQKQPQQTNNFIDKALQFTLPE